MTIVGRIPGGFLVSQVTQAVVNAGAGAPNYNPANRPTIDFSDFKQAVEAVISLQIEAEVGDGGAFVAHAVTPLVGRTLTVMVTGEDAAVADGAVFRELQLADAVDLSTKNIVAVAIGR